MHHQSVHCQRIIHHGPQNISIIAIIMFPFSFKSARKLVTTPWKAQDIPATTHIQWVATSPFPFRWERICESSFKSFTSPTMVGAAGK